MEQPRLEKMLRYLKAQQLDRSGVLNEMVYPLLVIMLYYVLIVLFAVGLKLVQMC